MAHHIVSSFNNVGVKDAEQLINIIQTNDGELFCQVKTSKRHITIPKKATKTEYPVEQIRERLRIQHQCFLNLMKNKSVPSD